MPPRLILFGVLILTALGLGVVGVQSMRPRADAAAPPPVAKVRVLTAGRTLAGGTLLKDEDLASIELPEPQVAPQALRDTPEMRSNLHGALVLHYLDKGARIGADDVLRPRDRGFLAAVLSPGMRAISVGVDNVTGAAGLIWPGDRVDLILTQQLDPAAHAGRIAAETILTNVRVIAVDQKLIQGASEAGAAVGNVARTVTLEVTPQQAERVAVADRLGRLSITVRSAEDAGVADASGGALFGTDVSSVIAHRPAPADFRMTVIQGTEHQEVKFP